MLTNIIRVAHIRYIKKNILAIENILFTRGTTNRRENRYISDFDFIKKLLNIFLVYYITIFFVNI